MAAVPYLDIPYSDEYARPLLSRLADGTTREFPPRENPGCSINFVAVEEPLKQRGLITYYRMGGALIQRVSGKGLLTTVTGILKEDPLFLLCSWELCPFCPKVRALLAR